MDHNKMLNNQLIVLLYMDSGRDITVKDSSVVIEFLECSESTARRILDDLYTKGFLTKWQDLRTNRFIYKATAEGQALADRCRREMLS